MSSVTEPTTDSATGPHAGSARQGWLDPTRRWIGAAGLVLGPVCFAAAEFTGPETSGTSAQMLHDMAGARGPLLVSALLTLLTAVFFVPGLFAMLSRPLARGRWFALAGLGLSLWSFLTNVALVGANAMFWSMTEPGMEPSPMVRLLESLHTNPLAPVMLSGHFVLVLGVLLLGIGLWRAGIGPRWAAAAIGLAGVADVALSPFGELGSIVSNALVLAGFGAQAWLLVREPTLSDGSVR